MVPENYIELTVLIPQQNFYVARPINEITDKEGQPLTMLIIRPNKWDIAGVPIFTREDADSVEKKWAGV